MKKTFAAAPVFAGAAEPSTQRSSSLRRWLLLGSMAVVVGGGLLSGLFNYADSREQVEELFDAEMAQMARTLQSVFASHPDFAEDEASYSHPVVPLVYEDFDDMELLEEEDDSEAEYTSLGHRYEKKLAFQVWNDAGKLLMQTRSAADTGLLLQPAGFRDITLQGEAWRLFTLADNHNRLLIQVAQRGDVRSELTLEIALHSIATSLLMMPVLSVLLWFLVSQGLKPLDILSRRVAARAPFDASPIPLSGALQEVQPLILALNGLFERVTEQAEREKQFTADAAHELRTPLAAIKINLQNAMRRTQDDKTGQSLGRSLAALDRLIALVEQLLTLNRIDTAAPQDKVERLDAGSMLGEVLNELQPVLQQKGIFTTISQLQPVQVSCNAGHLHSLLLNIVSNVARYGNPQSTLSIRLAGGAISITDEGPGIPEAELASVLNRFYRVGGDQSSGSGLGLSIVSRIVRLYGYRLVLKNREDGHSGLIVEITFEPPLLGTQGVNRIQ
jgi:two-component system sensor histidine kinase QseC